MSMTPQPKGTRRVPLGRIRPAWVHEIWSGKHLVGHTRRATRGWLAVPVVDAEPRWFRRHTDAMRWLTRP
jgi:hypothetical protein